MTASAGRRALRDALARFERPATVITESPDEESNQAIAAALFAGGSRGGRATPARARRH